MGWYVIVGSIPIGVVGLLAKDQIEGPPRSVGRGRRADRLVGGRAGFAERCGTAEAARRDHDARRVVIGFAQCMALVPGVSRSGATITAGLLRDLDRVTATRLSFLLAIPALVGCGAFELKDALTHRRRSARVVGTVVRSSSATPRSPGCCASSPATDVVFVLYRVAAGILVLVLLLANVITSG